MRGDGEARAAMGVRRMDARKAIFLILILDVPFLLGLGTGYKAMGKMWKEVPKVSI